MAKQIPYILPKNLPPVIEDGACNHLQDLKVPPLRLKSTANELIDLSKLTADRSVLFFFSRPEPLSKTENQQWNKIPGARGCTLEVLGFKVLLASFIKKKIAVYGICSLPLDDLLEFAEREHILFELISDPQMILSNRLQVPTFEFEDERYFKKLALICEKGSIKKVFYPVQNPAQLAEDILKSL